MVLHEIGLCAAEKSWDENNRSIFAKSSVEVMMMTVIVVGEVLVNNGAERVGVHRKDKLSAFVLQMISDCLHVLL